MSHKASGCVADCRSNVLHKTVCAGKSRLCARNFFAENVLIFFGNGHCLSHCGEDATVERMRMNGCGDVFVAFEQNRVDTFFAGGFVCARPFESFHIDFCHLFGFEHNVIDAGRSCKHKLVVKLDADVAPRALHEVFVEKSYACVLDVLSDFLFFVGYDSGLLFFFYFRFTAFRRFLLLLICLGIFEFEHHVLQKSRNRTHMLSAAFALRKDFGIASLVQNERCGENFIEGTSRHDRACLGEQAAIALTGKSSNDV